MPLHERLPVLGGNTRSGPGASTCTEGSWNRGVPLGAVLSRKVVTTDATLTGWGGVHKGFLAPKCFLPFLQGHDFRRWPTSPAGGYAHLYVLSRLLHSLTHRLMHWSSDRIMSLRATHVPVTLNTGADMLSWILRPAVVEQIWARFGQASVILFASTENMWSTLFFSL